MKKILVTGASGQIGSELIPALRKKYGLENVISGVHKSNLTKEVKGSGPSVNLDVADENRLKEVIGSIKPDTIFHLASLLSAVAEQDRNLSFKVNFEAVYNILEISVNEGVEKVIVPSSIGAFGPDTPAIAPNDTLQHPNTIYGISKVFGELLGNYYYPTTGLDVRGVRLPGILSWKVEPTAGTTDYAVAIFYGALTTGKYTCYLQSDTKLPMMYMPDAVDSLIQIAEADGSKLKHRSDFNVAAISFTPAELADAIKKRIPGFRIEYEIDPLRQSIADSWPDELIDDVAKEEWGWNYKYGLDEIVDDMIDNLKTKLEVSAH